MVWGISLLGGVGSPRLDQYTHQIRALQMFHTYVMNNTKHIINNVTQTLYTLEWRERNDTANVDVAFENTKIFCADENIKFIFFTPLGDVATRSLAYIDKNCPNQIGMGANGLPYEWYEDKSRVFSIPPITDERYVPILSFVKSLQSINKNSQKTKVGLIYTSYHIFYTPVCMGLLNDKLKKNYNYEIVLNMTVDANNATNLDTTRQQIERAVDAANATNVQALLACFLDASGTYYLKYIKQKKYDFDLLAVSPTSTAYVQGENANNTYMDYVLWVDDYVPQVERGNVEYFGNAKRFDLLYKEMFNSTEHAHPSIYRNLYAYTSAMKAVQKTESDNIEDLMSAMSRTDYETVVGRLTYDSYHRTSIKPTSIQTRFNGTHIETTVVGPPIFANAKAILPIPKYRERVYDPSLTPEEYAFLAIALAFIAISIVAGIIIIIKRHHPIIRSAAPLFMIGIITGGIFVYIGSIFFRIHQLSDATCNVQVWFLALGFILMFGCLFAKSFRVWRLWNANLAKPTQVITDSQLAMIVGILTSIQLVLLIIYSAAGGVKKEVYVRQPYRPFYDVEVCTNNTTGIIVLSLLVVYGFVLMIFGIFLAWTTRKVPFLAFNESRVILFSMYNVAFFTLLALIVVLNAREMNEHTEFILHSICILLSSFVTVSISVGNKFYLMLHGKTNKSKTQSISQKNPHTKSSLSDIMEDAVPVVEYEAIEQENETLKAKINNLQSKVGEFEE